MKTTITSLFLVLFACLSPTFAGQLQKIKKMPDTFLRKLETGLSYHYKNFKSGVSLFNEDSVAHIITYQEYNLTTAICEVKQGNTLGLKRGLDSASHRKSVAGFKILESEKQQDGLRIQIKAQIDPDTEVPCLCTSECSIKLENGEEKSFKSGVASIHQGAFDSGSK